MAVRKALVTGASSLVGRYVVDALVQRQVEVRVLDGPSDREERRALDGVDELYHFAELSDPKAGADDLFRANAERTRSLWTRAAECGVRRALLSSSTAVYGLASGTTDTVTEEHATRAFEPYGRSKRAAEEHALEIGERTGLATVVIRPVAAFAPGERNPLGLSLRRGAFVHFLLARAGRGRRFSFVHAGDVAGAAVHLMTSVDPGGRVYNVAVDPPISIGAALDVYLSVIRPSRWASLRARAMARVAACVGWLPLGTVLGRGVRGLGFSRWRPGMYVVYSARKLVESGYRFRWPDFERVLASCLHDEELV